uniref:Ectonucleoside triphosphate diphosphohydrolase 2 n=1 Tax=Scleropages formosus TaxID=113540 RepID=A0A8C9RTP2_SCLFO
MFTQLSVFILPCIAMCNLYIIVTQRSPPQYGIVLDAGSSHTTMYIYKWQADKQNGTGVVTSHSECHPEGGGISSYAGMQGAAGHSLELCLEKATKDIPKIRHHLTPVYLGATAGMRLLNITNSSASDQILQEVAQTIKSYPFDFRGAVILSGQEEGVYGWVTVNYLLEKFIKYEFVGRWQTAGRQTVGALDFGGASTQITFVTQEKVEDKSNQMNLRLYGQDYSLYTKSFLCYGRDQVLRRLMALLMKSQGYPSVLSHPCFPMGYNATVRLNSVFDSPCTEDYRPSFSQPRDTMVVEGTGDYQHCLANVSKLFSFDNCPYSRCSFNGTFQPPVKGSFMAFSAFYYIHAFLQLATDVRVTTSAHLEQTVHSICNMSLMELRAKIPKEEGRLHEYCPAAVFVQVLLLRGYRFDTVSFPQISFEKKAGGASVGWALGYMLSLSNMLPSESVGLRKALRPGAWSSLLFLFTLIILVALGYLLVRTCAKKKGGDNVL